MCMRIEQKPYVLTAYCDNCCNDHGVDKKEEFS